jgi:hypothetical protein
LERAISIAQVYLRTEGAYEVGLAIAVHIPYEQTG